MTGSGTSGHSFVEVISAYATRPHHIFPDTAQSLALLGYEVDYFQNRTVVKFSRLQFPRNVRGKDHQHLLEGESYTFSYAYSTTLADALEGPLRTFQIVLTLKRLQSPSFKSPCPEG